MKFKVLLKDWMEKTPTTVHKLSKETGINRITLRRYLYETPSRVEAAKIETLCKHFDCTPEEMLVFVPDNEKAEG
ncbi:helix-turn-helix transcriptional regulator [Halalkalibacterium halodurans]|uniref:helix-turn-helix domain-containing protein n=1 Tax=Halalkalibacterium halodurans TaxID=86665 RepID=UPI002E1FEECD|nr:helix-turn-helix transcriptional regulator [Halalkalibacterium halodurans]MED4105537.1 helix-turn-helix transcriptional regulator [Halalkalibacterium halodurans]MED4109257.1 helix-turn-helix transcriptional regulator [Halalkalibacterium halodurans]MED4149729.1 helix-turn-helix transcriptional regulator [Halalkalibacterium halodurans]